MKYKKINIPFILKQNYSSALYFDQHIKLYNIKSFFFFFGSKESILQVKRANGINGTVNNIGKGV